MGGLPGRSVSKRTLAAACRVGRGSVVVVPGVIGSIGRTSVIPAIDALAAEAVDAPAHGLGPTLRLDCAVRDGDRSGAADRLVEFRPGAEGEKAQCVDTLDDRVGWTDDSYRWEVGLDPPVGRKDRFYVRHDGVGDVR